jgi:hypothetical protein
MLQHILQPAPRARLRRRIGAMGVCGGNFIISKLPITARKLNPFTKKQTGVPSVPMTRRPAPGPRRARH